MSCGVVPIAKPFQGDRHMCLRLATAKFGPVLACLLQEVVDRLLMLRGDRQVIQEEAAAVQIQGNGRDKWFLSLSCHVQNLAIPFVDPACRDASAT